MSPSSSTSAFSLSSTASTSTTSTFEGPVALAKYSQIAPLQCPAALSSEPALIPPRPSFNSQFTNDRLRQSYAVKAPFVMETKIRKDRKSIFRELDMDDPSPVSPSLTAATFPPGPPSPSLETGLAGLSMKKTGTGSSTLSILRAGSTSIVSAPTSPVGSKRQKKSLSMRTPPSSRTVSFNIPNRAGTTLGTAHEEPLVEEVHATEREAPKRRWFALSRPKLKTATSAPPPTLKSLTGGSPASRRLR